jgi:GH15 family glucan-1,4-alpha-glucosidase
MFDPADPRIVSTMDQVIDRLTVRTPIGGVARYENDYYFQQSKDLENVPGNPWILSTLSIAHWYASRATNLVELQRAIDILLWTTTRCQRSGVLPEQLDPYTGAPLSVAPLTWSHASYVLAVHSVADRLNALMRAEQPAEVTA